MSFEALLNNKIYKSFAYSSQTAFGEWEMKYSTQTATGIKCRVSEISAKDMVTEPGRFIDTKYKAYMKTSENIKTGDQVIYKSDLYRIKEVRPDSTFHNQMVLLKWLGKC